MAGFFFGETAMTNVDPLELAKFDEHAHHWWDPTSEFRPLHEINPLRLSWIESHVTLAGKRVLDVGCGGGILSEGMAQRGAKVTGIDLSAAALDVAKLHLLESGLSVDYRLESAEDHAEAHPGAYEVVTCMELLEHVPQPESIVCRPLGLLGPPGEGRYVPQYRKAAAGPLVTAARRWGKTGLSTLLRWAPSSCGQGCRG